MRRIEVRIVKAKEDETSEQTLPRLGFEGKANIISRSFDHVSNKVGRAVIGYLIVDTVRQVIIAKAKS